MATTATNQPGGPGDKTPASFYFMIAGLAIAVVGAIVYAVIA
ncbi:MAG: hypothetical protein R2832_17480 [Rhodothermales bacterium]